MKTKLIQAKGLQKVQLQILLNSEKAHAPIIVIVKINMVTVNALHLVIRYHTKILENGVECKTSLIGTLITVLAIII